MQNRFQNWFTTLGLVAILQSALKSDNSGIIKF